VQLEIIQNPRARWRDTLPPCFAGIRSFYTNTCVATEVAKGKDTSSFRRAMNMSWRRACSGDPRS